MEALYHAAPPGGGPPTLRYRIERAPGGAFVAVAPGRPPLGPSTLADAWMFVEWRAIEDVLNDPGPGSVFVHAAGVECGGRLALLIGGPGSGKSTLTAHLLASGNRILGDDVLRFAPESGVFSAVPRSLKLDDRALTSMDLRTQEQVRGAPGTFLAPSVAYASPVAFRRDWEAKAGVPEAVVLLEVPGHRGPVRVERYSEGVAVVRVVQSMLGAAFGPAPDARAGAALLLLDALREASGFRAGGGDPAPLAAAIAGRVGNGR